MRATQYLTAVALSALVGCASMRTGSGVNKEPRTEEWEQTEREHQRVMKVLGFTIKNDSDFYFKVVLLQGYRIPRDEEFEIRLRIIAGIYSGDIKVRRASPERIVADGTLIGQMLHSDPFVLRALMKADVNLDKIVTDKELGELNSMVLEGY